MMKSIRRLFFTHNAASAHRRKCRNSRATTLKKIRPHQNEGEQKKKPTGDCSRRQWSREEAVTTFKTKNGTKAHLLRLSNFKRADRYLQLSPQRENRFFYGKRKPIKKKYTGTRAVLVFPYLNQKEKLI